MSTAVRNQNTPKVGTDPSITFRLPEQLRKQIEDAAWERRISMGELLRRFADDGMTRLIGESAAKERRGKRQNISETTEAVA